MEFLEESAVNVQTPDCIPSQEPAAAAEAEVATDTVNTNEEPSAAAAPVADRQELLAALKAISELDDTLIDIEEAARLKRQYYILYNEESRAKYQAYIAEGGDAETYVAEPDSNEIEFKELLGAIKEKKAAMRRRIAEEQQSNAERKRAIIDELTSMSADTDNVNRHYQRVKELQNEFKALGDVPQEQATEMWKAYTAAVELFYDRWKVNKELRDYDFKKNLGEKQILLAEARQLGEEADVITAFRRLQDLHQKWRETGPVAKELRDEIWDQFKDASAIVNKRYQAYFEERKAKERENEEAKTKLCEQIEAIDLTEPSSYSRWNELTEQIIAMQEEWKKLGFASRKTNNALFSRFRAACDAFFAAKASFFKEVKANLTENLAKKTALCEQAEALKDSTDWRKTTDKIIELQKEWKSIGAVPKKQSDTIWRRFMDACDYFFEQKKKTTSATRKSEHANLKAKQAIVARLTELNNPECSVSREEAIPEINELRASWQQTGHVPFRDKDKLHDAYRTVVGELFEKYDIRENRARMASFESNIDKISSDDNKLIRERERLMRTLEQRRGELKTYENNLGFFNSKTKSGEQIMREMERKMQHIKDEITEIEKKIAVVDAKL
ncbi:MAG: DUF349 domain-containing protein [Muribaculaceae bacterium]|nr:DUF349 domain-containing protein [Muribaculaceae bacterium]